MFVTEGPFTVTCGKFENGRHCDGRRIVADIESAVLRSIDQKTQIDHWRFEKIASSNQNDPNRGFFINGQRVNNVISRFDLKNDSSCWLSMKPETSMVVRIVGEKKSYGEHRNNLLQGRGMEITYPTRMEIAFWNKGGHHPGKYILIHSPGKFNVGEYITGSFKRYTEYKPGSSQRFGY